MSERNDTKERPILFSGEMVRAILRGQKSQTRRVIKGVNFWHIDRHISDWPLSKAPTLDENTAYFELQSEVDDTRKIAARCPYGIPGDRLWVRETFSLWHASRNDFGGLEPDYLLESIPKERPQSNRFGGTTIFYRADWDDSDLSPWLPSIHMPRWASRILLEITNVRIERIQDISEKDARAEGVESLGEYQTSIRFIHTMPPPTFAQLWDSINAKRGHSWASNPWVWVIEFRVL